MGAAAGTWLGVLGPIHARVDGAEHPLGDGLQARLVALLAARSNTTVSVDHLAEAAWRGNPPRSARNAIQVQVHRLRRLIGEGTGTRPRVVTTPDGYVLVADPSTLDALAFEELRIDARRRFDAGDPTTALSAARAALELQRGEPFGGLADQLGLEADLNRLLEQRLDVEDLEVDGLLRSSDARPDIGELRSHVAAQPFREHRWAQLMWALFAAGRQADALAAFREVTALLAEELGLEPGPELRSLEERILMQDVDVSGVTSTQVDSGLPHSAEPMVGRLDEIDGVARWVGDHRLVTLLGMGGVGKTRLAVATAERLSASFTDGVVFVDLVSAGDGEPVDEILRHRTTALRGEEAAIDAVAAALRGRNQLLVLDNAEHVVSSLAPIVDALVHRCPRVHVLVTSRVALGIPGECVWQVEPLDLDDAVELFRAAAARVRQRDSFDENDVELIVRLVASVDRIPLFVELAAAALRAEPLDSLASRLERDRSSLLIGGGGTVLDWSIDRLDDDDRLGLAALSSFRGGWSAEDASALLGRVRIGADVVSRLVDASLVTFLRADGRWRMLEVVRSVAARREPEMADAAGDVLTDIFVGRCVQLVPALAGFEPTESYRWFETEEPNLRAVLERGLERRDARILAALPALGAYWSRQGRGSDGDRWFGRIIERFGEDLRRHPVALLQAAQSALWVGRPDVALARVALVGDSDDLVTAGQVHHTRGNVVSWGLGRPAEALDSFRAAQDRLRAAGHPLALVSAISEAYHAARCGRFERARRCLVDIDEAARFSELFGHFGRDQVRGFLALYEGDAPEAERLLLRSVDAASAIGLSALRGLLLMPLVWTAVLLGERDVAVQRVRDAHEFVVASSGGWRIAEVYIGHGLVEMAFGSRVAATAWFERALRSARVAPEADLCAFAAAGLVETADWPVGDHRAAGAAVARTALHGLELAIPSGLRPMFPTVATAPLLETPVDVWSIQLAMYEVTHV